MKRYHCTYPVRLSQEQRRFLEALVQTSRTPAEHYLTARVLLMSNRSQSEHHHTDGQIAEALSISRRTVIRIKQRFVQENLEVALTGSFPRERPERRCLDATLELDDIISIHQSRSPVYAARWPYDREEARQETSIALQNEQEKLWLALRDGRLVGYQLFLPGKTGHGTGDILLPEQCSYLAIAATREEEQGRGVARALTARPGR